MNAVLIRKVSFKNYQNQLITLREETFIKVNVKEGIALFNGVFFDVDRSEYRLLN